MKISMFNSMAVNSALEDMREQQIDDYLDERRKKEYLIEREEENETGRIFKKISTGGEIK